MIDLENLSFDELVALKDKVNITLHNKSNIFQQQKREEEQKKIELFYSSKKGKLLNSKVEKVIRKLQRIIPIEIPLTVVFKLEQYYVENELRAGKLFNLLEEVQIVGEIKGKIHSSKKAILQSGLNELLESCCEKTFSIFGANFLKLIKEIKDLNKEILLTLGELGIKSL